MNPGGVGGKHVDSGERYITNKLRGTPWTDELRWTLLVERLGVSCIPQNKCLKQIRGERG